MTNDQQNKESPEQSIVKSLPGEAMVFIAAIKGFGLDNPEKYTDTNIRLLIGMAIILVVVVTYLAKLLTLTNISPWALFKFETYRSEYKGLFQTLLITFQALMYCFVIWGALITSWDIITEVSTLLGLFLTFLTSIFFARKQ